MKKNRMKTIRRIKTLLFCTVFIMGTMGKPPLALAEYQEDISQESRPFALKRILLFTPEGSLKDTCGAVEVSYFAPASEYIMDYSSEEAAALAYGKLREIFGKDSVMPDLPVKAQAERFSETDALSESWGIDMMGLDAARDKANMDPGLPKDIMVAVLDTGINASHSIFSGRLAQEPVSFVKGSDYTEDADGHGTHVAGIIADGSSDQIKILPVKVLNEDGRGGFAEVINGIYYALEKGADIINMSLAINLGDYGNYWSDTAVLQEELALEKAASSGCICIAAAGNDSRNLDELKVYPAISPHTITISSMTESKLRAASSNYGTSVDFTAPGDLIRSAASSGTQDYCIKSGTSMAAPHMTAACAMLRLYNHDASCARIYDALKKMAVDIGQEGKDKKFGYGYVTFPQGQIPRILPEEESGDKEEDGEKDQTKASADKTAEKVQILSKKPAATRILKFKKRKKSVKIFWKKQAGKVAGKRISGYQIQYSRSKRFVKKTKMITIKGWRRTSCRIRIFRPKEKYYFRVRTFLKEKERQYTSSWSKIKKVTVSK